MTDAALLDHIRSLPHARANFKQLVRELGAKGDDRVELETALARLAARGDLIELRSGHYIVTARSREFAVGRLNMHRDGYGFLISERPVPRASRAISSSRPTRPQKAMHGDRVVVRIARIEADGRADGEIVKVLKRAHPPWSASSASGAAAVRGPARRAHPQWIEIPEGMEIPARRAPPSTASASRPRRSPTVAELDGMIVNVELLEYPGEAAPPPSAASSKSWATPTISAWTSRSSSASITCRTASRPK